MSSSCFILFTSKDVSPKVRVDAVDYELLLFYESNGWVGLVEESDELEISYKGYVGILPLSDKISLAMLPKEFVNQDRSLFYDLATFLVNHYGTDSNMMNYSTRESNRYTFEDVFTLHELSLKLRDELLELKNIPLSNFVREKRPQYSFAGKVDIKSLIKFLYTKPGSKLLSEKNRIGFNSAENQIIKAAISKILKSSEIKEYRDLRLTFKKILARFSDVDDVVPVALRNIHVRNAKHEYKLAMIISKIILFDSSSASSRDVLSLGVPLVKIESDFFEVLSREAIRYSYPTTSKDQYVASSDRDITFNPDVVINLPELKLVGDSKYKTLIPKKHGIDNKADIYQLISHSLGYSDADSLFLLYPMPPEKENKPVSIYYDKITPERTVTAIWLDQEVLLKATTRRTRDRKLHEAIKELVNDLVAYHNRSEAA